MSAESAGGQCSCIDLWRDGIAAARCLEPADGADGRCTRCRNGHRNWATT